MTSRKPILVTGTHRFCSTWVGRMIAAHPSVVYIHEPFNPTYEPRSCNARFPYWYAYITDKNVSNYYYKHLKDTIRFRYYDVKDLRTIRSLKDAKKVLRTYMRFFKYRYSKAIPLVKDPIAFFSAEWLAKSFDMNVLVLIRHPAAFACSLKRLNWTCPFSDLLQQPLLIEDYLFPFEAQIKEFAYRAHDIIDQAALFWKIIHHVILEYQKKHEDWIFVRHEDVSRDPFRYFESIFCNLDREFSDQVRSEIQEYTDPSNPSEAPEGVAAITKRDSRLSIWNWKKRLSKSEIERIREQVEDISHEFYTEVDW